MLRFSREIAVAVASLCLCVSNLYAQPASSPESSVLEHRLVDLYQKYKDTVVKVKIATQSVDEEGQESVSLTVLSGFFIDPDGTVLTNAIPLNENARARVEINGLQFLAIPIASDQASNLSLLTLAKPPPNLSHIDLETAKMDTELGSVAYAITSPLHFASTPKLGLVTGFESSFQSIVFPVTYTRVSIPSGPAEGGSPVFNTDGKLIGVSVASLPDIESSYLVPTKALRRIVKELKKGSAPNYPTLHAEFETFGNPATLEQFIKVSRVTSKSDSPSSKLLEGDIVIAYNEIPISNVNALRDAIFYSPIGEFATLTVRRDDSLMDIPILVESTKQEN